MENKLFIPSKECTPDENGLIADHLNFNKRHGMEGMVAVLHKRKDGFREILPPTHNHIVMNGRKWVMQACMDQNYPESTTSQKDYTLNWFGVGSGGTLTNSPNIPLDTADTVSGLTSILRIKPNTVESANEYLYSTSNNRKRLKCYGPNDDDPYKTIVEMNYNTNNSEVMMLLQLELDYDDCPLTSENISVAINELGLYASPKPTETGHKSSSVLFSRYCRPTIYKTAGDAYLFMWYIYF